MDFSNPLSPGQQRQRIMGAPRNVAYMPGTGAGTGRTAQRLAGSFGGLNEFYALQDRSRPAFADPRGVFGLGSSAQEEGRRSTQAGLIYNPYLAAYLPDNMYTRTMGTSSRVPNVQPERPRMTDQQREWARKAQAGKSGSDDLRKMGEKMPAGVMPAEVGPYLADKYSVIPKSGASRETPTFVSGGNPYSGTRAQNFQNAVDAGEVLNTIRDFNRQNAGTGYSMGGPNTMGRITYKAAANTLGQQQLQAQIDAKRRAEMAAKGEAPVQFQRAAPNGAFADTESLRKYTQGPITSATKVNPYGTATLTFGERKGPGMVKDDLTGKMVPIRQAIADMKRVQATKGIAPKTGAPMDEKFTEKARKQYFASSGGGKGGKSKA